MNIDLPSEARRAPLQLLEATRLLACVHVAVKLQIVDLLENGPMSSEALARETGTHPSALHRVLRALAGGGVLSEADDGEFALAPVGTHLRRDEPDSLRNWVLMYHEVVLPAFGELLHTVKTGDSAFEHVTGSELFPYFAKHPEMGAIFDQAMTVETAHIAQAVLDAYDFSGMRKIVDVGGSHGTLLAAILQAHPDMQGVLFDRSRVIEAASRTLESAGLGDRVECVGGSFFKSVPAGCDAYILKNIIHDWNDEHAVVILSNCRSAMKDDGKILLVERLLQDEHAASLEAICADLDMLVLGGAHNARERTRAEYKALCRSADCELTRVIPAKSDHDYFVFEVTSK